MSETGGFPGLPPTGQNLRSGWFIGLGVVFLILGILAFIDTAVTTMASMVFVGFMLIIAGVAQLAQSFVHRIGTRNTWLTALVGALYIIGGFMLIEEPLVGSTFFTALLAGALIFAGVARAAWAAGHRMLANWWGVLLSGIVALLTGILVYVTLPWSGVWLIGTFIAIELIVSGVSAIAFGMALKNRGL